jgi:hypothetical protein
MPTPLPVGTYRANFTAAKALEGRMDELNLSADTAYNEFAEVSRTNLTAQLSDSGLKAWAARDALRHSNSNSCSPDHCAISLHISG